MPVLSVVIPLYNEEGNVLALIAELKKNLDPLDIRSEIILVNDGSTDGTWDEITRSAREDSRIKGLSFSRNFGHQPALLAGMMFSSGRTIISMDGDLQHPPEMIPKMIQAWREGYKVVNTKRISGEETSFFKRTSSSCFYTVFSFLSGIPLSEGSSDFRLIDRQVLKSFMNFRDPDLFFRGIISWVGFPSTTLSYRVRERFSGKSKYSLRKMIKFASTGIMSFSSIPLKIGIAIGVLTGFFAFLEILYIVMRFIQGATVPGWASTLGIISLLFGILFIVLGIIGIYLGKIHECLKNRPRFIISETVNCSDFHHQ